MSNSYQEGPIRQYFKEISNFEFKWETDKFQTVILKVFWSREVFFATKLILAMQRFGQPPWNPLQSKGYIFPQRWCGAFSNNQGQLARLSLLELLGDSVNEDKGGVCHEVLGTQELCCGYSSPGLFLSHSYSTRGFREEAPWQILLARYTAHGPGSLFWMLNLLCWDFEIEGMSINI